MKKALVLSVALASLVFALDVAQEKLQNETGVNLPVAKWVVPDEKTIPNNVYGDSIRYGQKLINDTYLYIGPNVKDENMRYAGNNMSCSSCHANGGTVKNQAGFVGIHARFPQYQARANAAVTLEDRINGCMQRSMNGKPLPYNSKEMRAMASYMKWLSTGVPTGAKIEGQGLVKVELLSRAADPKKGEAIYANKCASCHGANGEGVKNEKGGYFFPPLWGNDTYNTGAGMYRLIKIASYVKANMPKDNATLTDEEAFDVSAFVNMPSHKRPIFPNRAKDFPNLAVKPVDMDVGPYADSFSEEQHRYGPYKDMMK